MTADAELAYWKALAVERGRALDALHERLRAAIALAPESIVVELADALHGRRGWMRESAFMEPAAELRPSDVLTELHDVWTRIASDTKR